MSDMILEQNRLNGAVHQANVLLRYMRKGDMDAAAYAFERMEHTVLSSRHPVLFLDNLAVRLGRTRALAVGIEKPVIDRAIARL